METDTQHNVKASEEHLHKLYDEEKLLEKEITILLKQHAQLKEDIEAAEFIYMHQRNKAHREKKKWKH